MVAPFDQLVRALSRLPGIGRRSAERIALAMVRRRDVLLDPIVEAVGRAQREIAVCVSCGAITIKDENPCALCTDPSRDSGVICVVEDPDDIVHIERSGAFHGLYHSLNGRISPMSGVRPEDIRIDELLHRIASNHVHEVIFALGTDIESEATASYISEQLSGSEIVFSRIAFGLPADSAISYSDPITLSRAIGNRQKISNN